MREIWGSRARPDPLANYFSSMFSSTNLVDIVPEVISPTWRNGRLGSDMISKGLERFFMNVDLLGSVHRFRSWVIKSLISNHNSVCLQFDNQKERSHYPFKFNLAWLHELDFNLLIQNTWSSMAHWKDSSAVNLLVKKLNFLKEKVIIWKKEKKKKIQA
jgi:hypothetical protein